MRKTSTIGVVVPRITNPFDPEVLEAIGSHLEANCQHMVLWDREGAGDTAALDALREGSVDGVIFTSVAEGSEVLAGALRLGAPVVLLNRGSDADCDQVTCSNLEGSAEAARYLHQPGHQRLAVITGPENARNIRDRQDGFLGEAARPGAAIPPERLRDGQLSYDGGGLALGELLRLDAPPTAVFCANDVSAFGAIDAIREAGLSVPDDISVIGYDDVAMAAWWSYQLTTVSQQLNLMARRAVELLLRRIADRKGPICHNHFGGALVLRKTVAPFRG